jgi:nicotinamidase-related amidase
VNEIYIAGLDAAHCVNLTAQAVLNRNYKVHMIEDAVLAKSDALKDSMMLVFRDKGVQLVKIDSLAIK